MNIFDRKALTELRESAGVTVAALARVAGLKKLTVSNLEDGVVTQPNNTTIKKLADVLCVPTFYLYNDSDHRWPDPRLEPIERRLKIITRQLRVGVRDMDRDLGFLAMELNKLSHELDDVRFNYVRDNVLAAKRKAIAARL